jgi:hypothetical protein
VCVRVYCCMIPGGGIDSSAPECASLCYAPFIVIRWCSVYAWSCLVWRMMVMCSCCFSKLMSLLCCACGDHGCLLRYSVPRCSVRVKVSPSYSGMLRRVSVVELTWCSMLSQ